MILLPQKKTKGDIFSGVVIFFFQGSPPIGPLPFDCRPGEIKVSDNTHIPTVTQEFIAFYQGIKTSQLKRTQKEVTEVTPVDLNFIGNLVYIRH